METAGQNLHSLYLELGDLKGDFRNYNLYRFILKRLQGKSILDIGCGAGHFLHLVKEKGMTPFGLEENKELIELSKRLYNEDLGIIQGTAEKLNTLKNTYDSIVMIDVLEHIENDREILKNMREHLKDNGRIVILVPAYQLLYGKRDKNIGHFRRYTKSSLTEKIQNSGFKIVEARYWNMLGIVPYFIAEKILKKEFIVGFRGNKKKGVAGKFLNKTLFAWFNKIENPLSLGFGLSVLVVAEKQ